jgi:23S rRNA pseudouridine2605 synthase
MEERLQKIISRAGVASRRRAEQLMLSGQVTVNGRVVTELGTKADASRDHIKVSGKLLHGAEEHHYLALNKPAEVVATLSDPEGRPSLTDLLRGAPTRVYPVGRLSYHASGLLFLTNDGELANRLLRSRGVKQTYLVKLKGSLGGEELRALEAAVRARIAPVRGGENAWYEVSFAGASGNPLHETLASKGHPIEKMKRVKIGSLELGGLPPGKFRELTGAEVAGLEKTLDKADAAREFKLKSRGAGASASAGGSEGGAHGPLPGTAREPARFEKRFKKGGYMAKKGPKENRERGKGSHNRDVKVSPGERLVGERLRGSRKSGAHENERSAARMKRTMK